MGIDFNELEGFDWDQGNLRHIKKHKVEKDECEQVFFNEPLIILFDDNHSQVEERYKIIGISSSGRKLSLAVTIRNYKIRIITARDQAKKERLLFEKDKIRGGE